MNLFPSGFVRNLFPSFLLVIVFVGSMSFPMAAGVFDEGDPVNGETVFNANCATCHNIDESIKAAPGLGGLAERWGASEELLVQWIQNPQGALESGDPYIKSIVDQWMGTFGMMTPQAVNEDQIKDLMAYIQNPPAPAGGGTGETVSKCPTIHDNDDEISSAPGLWFLIIGILFLIIALSAATTNRSLKNAVRESRGEDPLPSQSHWSSLKVWMWENKVFVSVIGLFIFCYIITVGYIEAMEVGVYEGYEPEQPIWFSHAIHACENEIDCQYCHHSADKSKHAGIPSTNICMNCHKGIQKGTITGEKEIAKIYEAIGFDKTTGTYKEDYEEKPIQWVKVHNLPDHVYFPHSQHVEVAGLDCRNCHGPVETFVSGRIAPVDEINAQSIPGLIELSKPTLTMGWCIECHNKAEIDLQSSDYYVDMHERMKNSERGQEELRMILEDDKVTVKELGGWECAKCHY